MDEQEQYWYKVRIQLESEDENTGKIKKISEEYLVRAYSVTDTEAKIHRDFEGESLDYRIMQVVETKILKVIE